MADWPDLTDAEWAEILDKLTLYCVKKFWKLGWEDSRGFERAGPSGVSPQDIAMNAITALVEGRRNYNPEKYDDLYAFLQAVADSFIYHLAHSKEAHSARPLPTVLDEESGELVEVEPAGREPDPAEDCMTKDSIEFLRGVVRHVAAEDSMVMRLFECLDAGYTKRAEIAEVLEVDEKEIDKAQKRLRRALEKAMHDKEKPQ